MHRTIFNHAGKVALSAMLTISFSISNLYAATVTNNDGAAQTIVVTEGASKRELIIAPSETVDFCESGCFVTFPNGDREALKGDEKFTISGGKGSFE